MAEMDSAGFGQQAVKLGLIDERQLTEALEEVRTDTGKQKVELPQLLRALERKGWMTNWQSGKVLKGDPDGYYIGGYRMLYKIASGSFGRVFRAEDARTGRVVAIKVLRRRWTEDQQRISLFMREGRMGLTMKHPNIVEVLAVNQEPTTGQYYIVMEFVEGGNLREILQRRKTLTAAEALRILDDCVAALTYAYSRGITHRDIKLTNILISTQGEAKLVDFGLAQLFASFAKEDDKVERTVDYAGLEKCTDVAFGDVRSDLYFLGCVLYEMLSGRSPIVMTKDRHARMARRRFEEVLPLRAGEVDAPPSVYQLVETMMSLNPQRRYQTPSQLLDAVRACRREVTGNKAGTGGAGAGNSARTLFIAERDEHLQNKMRDKFKELGYRVLLASDPVRALDRFRQQPYEALIVDARTVGEDGLLVFDRIVMESNDKNLPLAAVLILAEEQKEWAKEVQKDPKSAILAHNVTLKQLNRKLEELLDGQRPA
jgi:tRNA A-37 threonylcarbamoyl transferase component Bud32